jgi:uncharacterized lipoprotein YajG
MALRISLFLVAAGLVLAACAQPPVLQEVQFAPPASATGN